MTEGKLVHSTTQGRFAVGDAMYGPDTSSGRAMQVRLGPQWISGRAEYAHEYGGYYFIADDGGICALCVDMYVRLL
jgi:hypothetical protein